MTFDKAGWLVDEIPSDAVDACSHSGDCYMDVDLWCARLNVIDALRPVESLARDYLREFGAWEDLDTASIRIIAERVLWIACNEINEHGDWLGLIH